MAEVSMCGLENGCCTRQIPYDMAEHDKVVWAKAIDEVFDFLKKQRDKKHMRVNFDDLEIRKYKEQLKEGGK